MEYQKPYISIVQECIDSINDASMAKLFSKVLSNFDENRQGFIKNTTGFFLADIISKFKVKGQKNIKDVLTSDVFKKCIKQNKEIKKLFKNHNLEDVFYAYTYSFVFYCKANPQDVSKVFGIDV